MDLAGGALQIVHVTCILWS